MGGLTWASSQSHPKSGHPRDGPSPVSRSGQLHVHKREGVQRAPTLTLTSPLRLTYDIMINVYLYKRLH